MCDCCCCHRSKHNKSFKEFQEDLEKSLEESHRKYLTGILNNKSDIETPEIPLGYRIVYDRNHNCCIVNENNIGVTDGGVPCSFSFSKGITLLPS